MNSLAGVGLWGRNKRGFFYVFVDLKPTNEKPDFYIVPSKTVANYLKKTHSEWLKRPKSGKPHNDTPMRLFEIAERQRHLLEQMGNLGPMTRLCLSLALSTLRFLCQ